MAGLRHADASHPNLPFYVLCGLLPCVGMLGGAVWYRYVLGVARVGAGCSGVTHGPSPKAAAPPSRHFFCPGCPLSSLVTAWAPGVQVWLRRRLEHAWCFRVRAGRGRVCRRVRRSDYLCENEWSTEHLRCHGRCISRNRSPLLLPWTSAWLTTCVCAVCAASRGCM